jgi:hypothetical protein
MSHLRLLPLVLFAACGPNESIKVINSAPTVSLVSPPDGTTALEGEAIEFEAQANDGEQSAETLMVTWSSDKDGVLLDGVMPDSFGVVSFATGNLTPGNHVVTVTVVDDDAASATDAVEVTVTDVPDAPTLQIAHPVPGEYGVEGIDFEFVTLVSDEQSPPVEIVVSWESNVDGAMCSSPADLIGQSACAFSLTIGEHLLTATAVDGDGDSVSESVFFIVLADDEIDDDGDGYSEIEGDCDDANPAFNPAAVDYGCNGVDEDCSGTADEGSTCYDDDGDCYCETAPCTGGADPTCGALLGGDCDDTFEVVYPGSPEVCDGLDNDCDITVDEDTSCYDDDGDGLTDLDGDCDDGDASVFPGAGEAPDGVDDDCDGLVDEGTTAYDDDGDCFCEIAPCTGSVEATCGAVDGGDCNDVELAVSPAAVEVCDGIDNNCALGIDEASAVGATTFYYDADGDGWGTSSSLVACTKPANYAEYTGDCNDASISTYPGAPEACDSVDNDCDLSVDEGVSFAYWRDADGDGYGNVSIRVDTCSPPAGYVANDDDCDDADSAQHPNTRWYLDSDGDGYGNPSVSLTQCAQPASYVMNATDCNDGSAAAKPGATETCSDSIDNDCDGTINEENASGCTLYYADNDNDGYGSNSLGSKCYCAATGVYDVVNASDCYDYDASAKPGQTAWFTGAHGGGTFDWNCDGSEEKNTSTIGGCDWDIGWSSFCNEAPAGWDGSVPSCGSNRQWIWDCHFDFSFSCTKDTYEATQSCR